MKTKNIFNKFIIIMLCLFVFIGCKNNSTNPGNTGCPGGDCGDVFDTSSYTDEVIDTSKDLILPGAKPARTNENINGYGYYIYRVIDENKIVGQSKSGSIYIEHDDISLRTLYMAVVEQVLYKGVKYQRTISDFAQYKVSQTGFSLPFAYYYPSYPNDCVVNVYLIIGNKDKRIYNAS